ncbi:hypothetical protein XI04_03395 [Bradyrhizobium sp. CCBAU 11430]|uniref:hypothetical protein n=1 Tax=Bradyrhizobium sp. CCBAU 11430 TaxID=1630881 RepID=UPI0023062571|nr:hypothetical protein [Bradyrhizobium sp. CCBAU 11430]MDA9512117.1 hypothetical protein [Bradyrhizobium sp. CCBAU 11430]
MGFDQVKGILEAGMAAWVQAKGRPAQLGNHGATFKWDTKESLLAASGHGKRLIQPELIGQNGAATNLIVDLRAGIAGPALRMPKGGPFIPDDQIKIIEDWITQGCPD